MSECVRAQGGGGGGGGGIDYNLQILPLIVCLQLIINYFRYVRYVPRSL